MQRDYYDMQLYGYPVQLDELVYLHTPIITPGIPHTLHRAWQGPYVVLEVYARIRLKDDPHAPPLIFQEAIILQQNVRKATSMCLQLK